MKFSIKAFTLIEVLITLTLLGVVAALTIPSIINRYNEKITVVKAKKMYSVLTNAFAQSQAENGPVYSWDIGDYHTETSAAKAATLIKPHLQIKKDCGTTGTGCFPTNITNLTGTSGSWTTYLETSNHYYRFQINNGVSIAVWSAGNTTCRTMNSKCISITVDVNGLKEPNKLGVDIFRYGVYSDLNSGGEVKPDQTTAEYCKYKGVNSENGTGCLNWIIKKGNMDYLRRDISSEW